MPTYCCVPLCKQSGYLDSSGTRVSFHRFPRDATIYKKWIAAIKRDEGQFFQVSAATKVCSRHFLAEDFVSKVASGQRMLHDHAVPSIFSFKKPTQVRKAPRVRLPPPLPIAQPAPLPEPISSPLTAPTARQPQGACQSEESSYPDMDTLASCTDLSERALCTCSLAAEVARLKEKIEECMQKVRRQQNEIEATRAELKGKTQETYKLQADLQDLSTKFERLQKKNIAFGIQKFKASNEDVQFYTGLPSYSHFQALLEFIDPGEDVKNIIYWKTAAPSDGERRGRRRKLSIEDQLFLVLVKLRVGLFHKHLGHLFDVSEATVSRVFLTWMSYLYLQLTQLPLWLPRDVVDRLMPDSFKEKYESTRVIIDATEVRCELSSSLVTQSGTYSYYKSANTFKGLIGIAPNGQLTFVSELFMGSVSDREAVIKSGHLERPFEAGDSVMADKGFKIQDLLEKKGVSLNIPPFLTKEQFLAGEVQETQDIAALRIHVERRIQRIKTYHILDRPIAISLAPLANQIWTVCAILANMQSPLMRYCE
ncbi:unnamed protein product [Ixodes pacificus]